MHYVAFAAYEIVFLLYAALAERLGLAFIGQYHEVRDRSLWVLDELDLCGKGEEGKKRGFRLGAKTNLPPPAGDCTISRSPSSVIVYVSGGPTGRFTS